MPKSPVQQRITGQVQDSVGHLVNPLWSLGWREHGKADVLQLETVQNKYKQLARIVTATVNLRVFWPWLDLEPK